MLAVEFAEPGTLSPRADLAKEIAALCHAQGLLVLVCGTYSNVLRLLPPLVIEESLLNDGLTVLRDVIQQVNDAHAAIPLAGFQLTQQKLVDMAVEINKGTLLALHLGRLKDAGRLQPLALSSIIITREQRKKHGNQ